MVWVSFGTWRFNDLYFIPITADSQIAHLLPCDLGEQENLPFSSPLRSHRPDRPLHHVSHRPVWSQSSGEHKKSWFFRSLVSLLSHNPLLLLLFYNVSFFAQLTKFGTISHPLQPQSIFKSPPSPFSLPAPHPQLSVNLSVSEDCPYSQSGSECPQWLCLLHGPLGHLLSMPLTWDTVFSLDYRNGPNCGYIFKTCMVLLLNMPSGL